MKRYVRFCSTKFKPILPETAQVNPEVYGAELAFWLCGALAQLGVVTSYPGSEDWGWFIEYFTDDGLEYWVTCQNNPDVSNGWICGVEPKSTGLFGRKPARMERAQNLLDAINSVLEKETTASDIVWAED